jgi:hypothetical protein
VTTVPTIFLIGKNGQMIQSNIPVDDLEEVIKKNID